jgi:hypothetical protein
MTMHLVGFIYDIIINNHYFSLSLSPSQIDQGPAASSFESPSKVGWLYKHGGSGVSSHWRKRWFVADHHYLFYYKGPNVRSADSAFLEDSGPLSFKYNHAYSLIVPNNWTPPIL